MEKYVKLSDVLKIINVKNTNANEVEKQIWKLNSINDPIKVLNDIAKDLDFDFESEFELINKAIYNIKN